MEMISRKVAAQRLEMVRDLLRDPAERGVVAFHLQVPAEMLTPSELAGWEGARDAIPVPIATQSWVRQTLDEPVG